MRRDTALPHRSPRIGPWSYEKTRSNGSFDRATRVATIKMQGRLRPTVSPVVRETPAHQCNDLRVRSTRPAPQCYGCAASINPHLSRPPSSPMKMLQKLLPLLFSAILSPFAWAGGHTDAPAIAQYPGAAIGDVFIFQDPGNNTLTDLIATVHPYLIPGEALNQAVFDPAIRFRFEVYNDHVDQTSPVLTPGASASAKAAFLKRVKPNRTIDITFSPRQVGDGSTQPTVPANLRLPLPQTATLTLGGFTGLRNKGIYTTDSADAKLTVNSLNLGANPVNFTTQTVSDVTAGNSLTFFAGVTADPFFCDLPALSAYLDSLRSGTPSTAVFSRARDSFSGYNVLAIAIQIPTALLAGPSGTKIGVDFLTQRKAAKLATATGSHYTGAFRTLDRMGHPLVTTLLIPYDSRNAYASSSPARDVRLDFADEIAESLTEFGLSTAEVEFTSLLDRFVANGDLLLLDTSITNTGTNLQASYPNGRRTTDDSVDIILTSLNHGTTLGDGVNASRSTPVTFFPYLGHPNQPRYDTATDDGTRN